MSITIAEVRYELAFRLDAEGPCFQGKEKDRCRGCKCRIASREVALNAIDIAEKLGAIIGPLRQKCARARGSKAEIALLNAFDVYAKELSK